MTPDFSEWQRLDAIAGDVGDAFYVYDESALLRDIGDVTGAVTSALPSASFRYPYKVNFTPEVCRAIASRGWGAEVDSPMLLWLARRIGVPADLISYNGIARDPASLRDALLTGNLVVLDADRDIEVTLSAAEDAPSTLRVAIRLNVPTAAYAAPRLGRTREQVRDAVAALTGNPRIDLLGLTMHTPDPTVEGVQSRVRDMVDASAEMFPQGPRVIGFGGALVPPRSDLASGYADVARVMARELERVPWGSHVTVLLEPGASALAPAFEFAARVVDVKAQEGRTVVNVAGSIFHTSPNTRSVRFPVRVVAPSTRGTVSGLRLVGGCTAVDGDWLSVDVPVTTAIHRGDFLVFDAVGAYSTSMGTHFTDPLPAVVSREGDRWRVVRRQPTFEETLAGFEWGTA
ncbi:MAG: hypothetical protein ACKOT0_04115 [bacterium]